MDIQSAINKIINKRVAQMMPNQPNQQTQSEAQQPQIVLLPGSTPGGQRFFNTVPGVPNGKEVAVLQTSQFSESAINEVILRTIKKYGYGKDSMIPPDKQDEIINEIKKNLTREFGGLAKLVNPAFFR